MGISIWQIIILVALGGITIFGVWLNVRILNKAGYSGWWTVTLFVPLVNIVMIWVFAFSSWPKLASSNNSNINTKTIQQPISSSIETVSTPKEKLFAPTRKILVLSAATFVLLAAVVLVKYYLTNTGIRTTSVSDAQSQRMDLPFQATDFGKLKGFLLGHWIRIDGSCKDGCQQYFGPKNRIWVEGGSRGSTAYKVAKANYPANWIGIDLNNSGDVSTIVQFDETGRKMRMITFVNFGDGGALLPSGITGLSSDWVKVDNQSHP